MSSVHHGSIKNIAWDKLQNKYIYIYIYNPHVYMFYFAFQCIVESILIDFSLTDGGIWVIFDAQYKRKPNGQLL